MWSLIRANRRRSAVLILSMGALLALFGYALGGALEPGAELFGVAAAVLVWAILMAVSVAGGEKILLAQAGAREVSRDDAPQLWNVVEEMKIAAGLPHMPKVYIVDDPAPNAFAVGLSPDRAAVAATTGLLARLNRDELQGVMAHEVGHIANRDTLFLTLAATTLGAIVLLSDFYLRGLRWGGFRGRRSSSSNNQGAAILLVLALVLAILSPLLARLLYFACSRRREYLADASAARFTRYPEGLASALEKIARAAEPSRDTSRVLAPLYIVNPLAASGAAGLFSTHPPLEDRVRVLRTLTADCSLAAYERAYRDLHGQQSAGMAEADPEPVPVREAPREENEAPGWRAAKNVLHHLNAAQVITCPCGVSLKVPAGWPHSAARCPRCGTVHPVAAS